MTMLQAVTDAIHDEDDWPGIAAGLRHPEQVQHQQALAVLATDEMQAIRNALLDLAESIRLYPAEPDARSTLHAYDVPDSVIAWVLEDRL